MDRKKFLNELSKLLTFMYEEDCARALELYQELFRDASDEDAVLQLLVSPTRQAVVIARAYNAQERKLGIRRQSGEGSADVSGDAVPEFVNVILDIRAEGERRGIIGVLDEDDDPSGILFEEEESAGAVQDAEPEDASVAEYEGEEDGQISIFEEQDAAPAEAVKTSVTASGASGEVKSAAKASEEENDPFALPDFTLDLPEDLRAFLSGAAGKEPAKPVKKIPAGSPVSVSSAEASAAETDADVKPSAQEDSEYEQMSLDELVPDPSSDAGGAESHESRIDRFMEEFSMDEDALSAPAKAPTRAKPAVKKEPASEKSEPQRKPTHAHRTQSAADVAAHSRFDAAVPAASEASSCSIPILVVYILLAVPVTALLILLLMIPALTCLGLAIGGGYAAFFAISSAFAGFAVFADIMVVIGAGLVALALAMLFLWLFFWFIFGAIGGMINWAIRFGTRLCFREEKKS